MKTITMKHQKSKPRLTMEQKIKNYLIKHKGKKITQTQLSRKCLKHVGSSSTITGTLERILINKSFHVKKCECNHSNLYWYE